MKRIRCYVVAAILPLITTLTVQARVLNVPNNYDTIQQAIDAARATDTVLVSHGAYRENISIDVPNLTVASLELLTGEKSDRDSTTIQGATISDLEDDGPLLFGFTVINGGGVNLTGTRATLNNLSITRCTTGVSVQNYAGDQTVISDCLIQGNGRSNSNGGGTQFHHGAAVRMERSNIVENTGSYGGGIFLGEGGCEVEMFDCNITGNSARMGAGIYASSRATIGMTNTDLCDNVAENWGGGFFGTTASGIEMHGGVVSGNRAVQGGGFCGVCGPLIELTDVKVVDNEASEIGGGFGLSGGARVNLDRVLIARNRASDAGGGIHCDVGSNQAQPLMNVTFADNYAAHASSILLGNNSHFIISNSILMDGAESVVMQGPNSIIEIDYSAVSNLEDDIVRGNGVRIGECMIEGDPGFIEDDPDYNLANDSPCIDAGDPESPHDPDESIADLGWRSVDLSAIPYGIVTDSETGTPLQDVMVQDQNGGFTITDENGNWLLRSIPGEITLTASLPGYNSQTEVIQGERQERVEVAFNLLHPAFGLSDESFELSLDKGADQVLSLVLANPANGELEWSTRIRLTGEEEGEEWEVRHSLEMSDELIDPRLFGAIYANDQFFVTGREDDRPQIIVLDKEGQLVCRYDQPGSSRYGMTNLAYDGESFWGMINDTLYQMNSTFEVQSSTPLDFNLNRASTAWDSENQVLWMSGVVTNIQAFDRQGNRVGEAIPRGNFRIYGLGYCADDPQGAALYLLTRIGEAAQNIYRVDMTSREIEFVKALDSTSVGAICGLSFAESLDRLNRPLMINLIDPADAEEPYRLEFRFTGLGRSWLSAEPTGGIVAGNGEQEILIRLETEIGEERFSLEEGVYTGEIIFNHNAAGGREILPIQLTVTDIPDAVEDNALTPGSTELVAAYPNPFNARTTLRYNLASDARVNLSLFDMNGRLVEVLNDGVVKAGNHSLAIDGGGLPTGAYVVRLAAGEKSQSMKVMVMR